MLAKSHVYTSPPPLTPPPDSPPPGFYGCGLRVGGGFVSGFGKGCCSAETLNPKGRVRKLEKNKGMQIDAR